MKTDKKRLFAHTSGAIAAVLLAFSFAVGGSNAVRAEDSESLTLSVQDTVLIPVKDLEALEQRVRYLEETVTALTESWQHINTHRLCVSDDSGAETCITKPQLDALLAGKPRVSEISPAPAIVGVESVTVAAVTESSEPAPAIVGVESVTVATMTESSEPAPSAVPHDVAQTEQEPEYTGSITARAPMAELKEQTESIESSSPAAELNAIPEPEAETVPPGDQP
jgi:hypothetical protein